MSDDGRAAANAAVREAALKLSRLLDRRQHLYDRLVIRLAYEIADEAAWSDIECECIAHADGGTVWYLAKARPGDDAYPCMAIERAVRYLTLRNRLVIHPSQPALVRLRNP